MSPTEPGLFECMFSMRAMRRLKPDPIPQATIEKLLQAATQAPSGQNTQPWAFLVLTEAADRQFFADHYRHWFHKLAGGNAMPDADDRSKRARQMRAAGHLADHMHEVPLIVLAFGKRDWPFVVPKDKRVGLAPPSYGSIYPAVQNLLLACRGLGLGASLTTMHQMFQAELYEHFEIPQDYGVVASIPIGYPQGNFGPVSRRPLEEKVHYGRWNVRAPGETV